jgi:hypothetical protein
VTLGRDAVPSRCAREAASRRDRGEVEGFREGFGTVVGERVSRSRAATRSGSRWPERWRREPTVLVLDDVFASVDAVKEEEIVATSRARRRPHGVAHDAPPARGAGRLARGRARRGARGGAGDARRPRARRRRVRAVWRIQQLEEEIARA